MKICQDAASKQICSILNESEKQCFVVGGAVRDDLLGGNPKDIDFTTDATPDEVISIFEHKGCKVVPTGIKHGTVTVFCGDRQGAEITTFRTEGKYLDGRRPESVSFVNNIADDLSRRDFTINAMALDPLKCKIVDPYGGQRDLQNGVIRAVGQAKERFMEDGLRPLRAARFAARYGFSIEKNTRDAMSDPEVSETFEKVSKERVHDEFTKALTTNNPTVFIQYLHGSGLLKNVMPELKELPMLRTQTKDSNVRMAELLQDTPQFKSILNRLRFSRNEIAVISKLISFKPVTDESAKRVSTIELAISGKDLLPLGYEGKAIGEKLKELYKMVINNPDLNTREQLLKLV